MVFCFCQLRKQNLVGFRSTSTNLVPKSLSRCNRFDFSSACNSAACSDFSRVLFFQKLHALNKSREGAFFDR